MPKPTDSTTNALHKPLTLLHIILLLLIVLVIYLLWSLYVVKNQQDIIHTVSKEGVISQIQELSRLQTISYNIDTVITSEKEGSWQTLWQDKQKALFIAHGKVQAGMDLSLLSADMLDIRFAEGLKENEKTIDKATIYIDLPKAQIFEVYLDNIEVYDWQTGMMGMVDTDPKILTQAQASAKNQVLKTACKNGILQTATDNAKQQISHLFTLTGVKVVVKTTESKQGCS